MLSRAKWKWQVVFMSGEVVDIPVAVGAKDARLQSMWIVKERTGAFPRSPVVEVRKMPTTAANAHVYMRYRTR